MSSGILAMAQIYGSTQAVSMLVIKMEALYYRKAVGTTIFTCLDGLGLINCIESAIATGEGQVITTKSTGIGPEGMLIAEFFVTWSFKVKKERTK